MKNKLIMNFDRYNNPTIIKVVVVLSALIIFAIAVLVIVTIASFVITNS